MRLCMVLALAACVSFAAGAIPVISQVRRQRRTESDSLSTRAGDAYQPSALEQDVRALHATGRFADVRVESISAPEGQRLTFQLTPMPRLMLRKVEIIPDDFPLKARALQGEVVTPARAQSMANEYRRGLVSAGYPDAVVTSELVVVGPSLADVKIHVTAGKECASTRSG